MIDHAKIVEEATLGQAQPVTKYPDLEARQELSKKDTSEHHVAWQEKEHGGKVKYWTAEQIRQFAIGPQNDPPARRYIPAVPIRCGL